MAGRSLRYLLVGLGALAALIFAPRERRLWITAGIGYAGAMLLAPMLLRADDIDGFLAMVLLFAIVWTTDVLGYFAGRAFGGPKLLPAVSPKKTWSGAIAGTLGAMLVAVLVASLFGAFNTDGDRDRRVAAVGGGAARRSARILGQAPVRRQGCEPSHSRPWRRDGPARRFLGGRARSVA